MPYFERPYLLANTLLSYSRLMRHRSFEVVVVDDHSRAQLRPEIPKSLPFPVRVVTMKGPKEGVNPSLPIEIGVCQSDHDIIILTSPEVAPVADFLYIEDQLNVVETLRTSYLVFDVFALTDSELQKSWERCVRKGEVAELSRAVQQIDELALSNLGFDGYAYANRYGAWYQHHSIKNSKRHFLSMISREWYERLGGFNLSYRRGRGFEDDEFLGRISRYLKIRSLPGLSAIHQMHNEVSVERFRKLNSNELLFKMHALLQFRLKGSKRLLETANYAEEEVSDFET